jgi:hypothetical protein
MQTHLALTTASSGSWQAGSKVCGARVGVGEGAFNGRVVVLWGMRVPGVFDATQGGKGLLT